MTLRIGLAVVAGALQLGLLFASYSLGRAHADTANARAQAKKTAEAVLENETDKEKQAEYSRTNESAYLREIAERDRIIGRLRRADDGDLCSDIDDGDRMWRGRDSLSAPGLRSGAGIDVPEPAGAFAPVGTGQSPDSGTTQ